MNELLSFSYHSMKDHFLVWNVNEGTQILFSDSEIYWLILSVPFFQNDEHFLEHCVRQSLTLYLQKLINGAWKSSLLFELSNKHFRKGLSQRRSPQTDSTWGLGILWQLGCRFHWYVSSSCADRISVVKYDTCGFTAPKATRKNSLPTCFSCIKRAGKIHLHDHSETMESPWQDVKEKKESEVPQSCLTLRPHGLQRARLPCP